MVMNQADTFANTGGPILGSHKKKKVMTAEEAMDYARSEYGKLDCPCELYKDSGTCFCPGKKSIDNIGGGKNPHYSEIIEGPFYTN